MHPTLRRRYPALLLAGGLLVATVAWHIPLMLWDHLDLVPLLVALQAGQGLSFEFWAIHGGHFHSAAYAVLIVTTTVSGGQPWLDCVVSWLLLGCFAWLIARFTDEARKPVSPAPVGADDRASAWWLLPVMLALHPGHLANLQWGWQVAVFLCLLGVGLALLALTRPRLGIGHNTLALAAALLALASFATAIALIPAALLVIALRHDIARQRRLLLMLPWLALGLAAALFFRSQSLHAPAVDTDLVVAGVYALNFLGGGIGRFATTVAPWLAVLGLASAAAMLPSSWARREALPWIGLMAFALGSAVAVALGRAGAFGADQAFATRYVSFSLLFWIGWVGLLLVVRPSPSRRIAAALALVLLFALGNAVQMTTKAARVAADSRAVAAQIHATHPAVDEHLLGSIYFDDPSTARERLAALNALGYAPFGRPPATPD
jgi:hypothetical protein